MAYKIFLKKNPLPLQTLETTVPSNSKGNRETVRFMQKVASLLSRDPKVRDFALRILTVYQTPSHDNYAEARAIGDFVKRHVPYVKDPVGTEYLTDPRTLIDQIESGRARGDCDDMSLLIATLLGSIGINSRFRFVMYEPGSPSFDHIYVVTDVADPKTRSIRRLALDAILKKKPIGAEVDSRYAEEAVAIV